MNYKLIIFISMLFCISVILPAQEAVGEKTPLVIFFPVGYDFFRLEELNIHSPAAGIGFMLGEQDIPFNQVERRFFGMALYQPFIFSESPLSGIPKNFHQIGGLLDGRIGRHQLLFIFSSSSDKPVAGGLNTFSAGAGWGYEVIRRHNVSLILGIVAGVSDFGITTPSGNTWPVLPLPLIRFGIDTQWFAASFDFMTGPIFEFTVAPKGRIRLTGEMRMENYRSNNDLIYEFTLWYRLFREDHKMGDFAGIGAGIKNDLFGFNLSRDINSADTFELQQCSIFAVLDLSILKVQGGWIFNSNYIVDDIRNGSPGKGFFISVQGMIPVKL